LFQLSNDLTHVWIICDCPQSDHGSLKIKNTAPQEGDFARFLMEEK